MTGSQSGRRNSIGRSFRGGELDRGRFVLGLGEASELYSVGASVATFGRMPAAMERLAGGEMPVAIGGVFET